MNQEIDANMPLLQREWAANISDFPHGDLADIMNGVDEPGLNRPSQRLSKQLACISCRRKKVKCQPSAYELGGCVLCVKLGAQCSVPEVDERRQSNSRKLIRELYSRVASLEAELESHRKFCLAETSSESIAEQQDDDHSSPLTSIKADSISLDNMIVRLCGGQRQLNSDRVGRLRFFGPTSSLHLTESVTSSILIREPNGASNQFQWQDDFPLDVQNYLLELFWKYQHQVLPVIHKEAFLRDMNNGDTKYCSRLLVYCILTRAAAISDQPGLRALALADDADDDPPFLVRKCVALLETELNNPGITTNQALQLVSEMHCAISNDTKGWMYAGGACRLAHELGLHSDSTGLSTALSKIDLEVRQLVFWSCFNLDRQWALYLGRPQCIKLDDVSIKRCGDTVADGPWEMRMSAAWTNLLEVVGMICDNLNGVQTTNHRVTSVSFLHQKLRDWKSFLDPAFHHNTQQVPAVFLLHMQYSAALILLHRPLAHFGNDSERSQSSESSRQLCVDNACLISQYIQEYYDLHGSIMTMSWVALHIIATASTTLVGNIAERKGDPDNKRHLICLQKCLRGLNELEKSHVVTKRVRKVIQLAIRLLNLDATINSVSSLYDGSGAQLAGFMAPLPRLDQEIVIESAGFSSTPQIFPFTELMPSWSQFDMLNSFESYFS